MGQELSQLRVHIVPVGFEKDRVVKPLLELNADKIYLIGYSDDTKGVPFLKYAKQSLDKIKKSPKIEYCNRNDLFDLLACFKRIIDKEKENNIYINVSSGGTFPSIAGMMSSMLFSDEKVRIIPYYVTPEKYTSELKKLKSESMGVLKIIQMPSYKASLPSTQLIQVMKYLEKYPEGVSKKQLIQYVFDEGIAKSQKYESKKKHKKLSPIDKQKEASNRQMWVNHNIINKLGDLKLIDVDGRGKSMLINLSKEGQNMAKFL